MAVLLRIVAALAALCALLALGFFTLTGRLAAVDAEPIDLSVHPAFRSWDEHDAIYRRARFPYIVEIESGRGAVLYIGAQHSSDPDDPQWERLRSRWDAFAPTIALNEGRSRYFRFPSARIGGINDPKLALILARRDGIPIYSLEPAYQVEVDALLESWPAEVVACYLSLRVITGEAGGDAGRAESIAPGLIAKRTDADGLRGTLAGVSDLDRVWREQFPDAPDWRGLDNLDSVEAMRRIGDDAREVRGRHMVRALTTLARRGERVVAVVGASHVIRHEPTLRSLLR